MLGVARGFGQKQGFGDRIIKGRKLFLQLALTDLSERSWKNAFPKLISLNVYKTTHCALGHSFQDVDEDAAFISQLTESKVSLVYGDMIISLLYFFLE